MKIFNSKAAAEEYMSSHTLTFSTPELTLMRYSFWLGDIIPDPKNKEETMPRMMTYLEDRNEKPIQIIDDEKYIPTGAVRNITRETNGQIKYCSECGTKNSLVAKFCIECGDIQK